ncbi:MAG: alkaline phosphatase D family protein [Acidimicrobiales bacterium]
MIDRRGFLRAGAGTIGAAALGGTATACAPDATTPSGVFSLGVTSGLHSPTEAVLWTRVDLANAPTVTSVGWEVATTPAFTTIVQSGTAAVNPLADGCVKVLAGSLSPDTNYWYRFTGGAETSTVGRARTLPLAGSSPASLKVAFCSCQSYANGYYGAWRGIAAQDLDFVVFLGDYIYESALIQILRPIRPEPTATVDTLDEYRAKYRLYRSDADLQSAHAAHPLVPIWDDHEIENDYDKTVFTTEPDRAAAAYQAWFEYMPVWPFNGNQIYRSLRWGNLGEIFLLDSRQYRDEHLGTSVLGILGLQVMTGDLQAAGRSMLGTTQRQWLLDGLDQAQSDGVQWKLIGNQVMIAPIRIRDDDTPAARAADPSLPKHAGLYLGTDSWDGFGWERDLVLSHIGTAGVQDVAFLTGDVHSFFAAPLRTDFDDPAAPTVAYEYTGGSISSPSGIIDNALAAGGGSYFTDPAFDYSEIRRNGFGIAECTPSGMSVTFHELEPVVPWATSAPAVRFDATPGVVQPVVTVL